MKYNQQRKRAGKSEQRRSVSLFERIQPDAAGVDCGQKSHFVAVPPERDPEPVREFRTFTTDLQHLAEWLAQCGVKTVAMESTGVYWIPLYEILEQHGFEVVLVWSCPGFVECVWEERQGGERCRKHIHHTRPSIGGGWSNRCARDDR